MTERSRELIPETRGSILDGTAWQKGTVKSSVTYATRKAMVH